MSEIDLLPDKIKNRMEQKLKKYKSELKINRLIFLGLAFINLIVVMVLSFTGLATGSSYNMSLTYVQICILISALTVVFAIVPIIKHIID